MQTMKSINNLTLTDRNGAILPALKASFTSTVVDFMSITQLKLDFQNTFEADMIEVFYTHPVDPDAALTEMRACFGDREVVACVKEKELAKDMYLQAVAEGHGASIVERDANQTDIYCLSVGNISAGESVSIILSFVTELILVDNQDEVSILRFSLPLGLFDRYSPVAPESIAGPSCSETSPHDAPTFKILGGAKEVPTDICVNLKMPCDIASVMSPSAVPLQLEFEKNNHRCCKVMAHTTSFVGDFVILIQRAVRSASSLWISEQPEERIPSAQENEGADVHAFVTGSVPCMLTLHPMHQAPSDESLNEVIFIVDRSG